MAENSEDYDESVAEGDAQEGDQAEDEDQQEGEDEDTPAPEATAESSPKDADDAEDEPVAEPPPPAKVARGKGRPPTPVTAPRCKFILTRGARKGQEHGTPAKVGDYCKAHSMSPRVTLENWKPGPGDLPDSPKPKKAPKPVKPVKAAKMERMYQSWGSDGEELTMRVSDMSSIFADIMAAKAEMKSRGPSKVRKPPVAEPEPREEVKEAPKRAAKKEAPVKRAAKKEPESEPPKKAEPPPPAPSRARRAVR